MVFRSYFLRPTMFLACTFATALSASAQTECATDSGPDIIIGDITGPQNYTGVGGLEAFALGHVQCNIGSAPIQFRASPNNQHPVYASNLFKVSTVDGATRFEHLGQSWVMHAFTALAQGLCCPDCDGMGGSVLGVHCSDSNTAGSSGSQGGLGPKWQINAATGQFPSGTPTRPTGGNNGRVQVRVADLEPGSASVRYFAEEQVIAPDDAAAGNDNNNLSFRPANVSGSGVAWTLSFTGPTQRERAAIRAWRDHDPGVVEGDVQVTGDGLFIVAARATAVPGSRWRYEYAIYNLNSDRSAQAFSVPVSDCITVANAGFHDVDYLGGDGPGGVNYDGTDWLATIGGGAITWATQTFEENQSANALRWGTLYNFRFDADALPQLGGGNATLTLFMPGEPATVPTGAIPVPGNRIGDLNGDGAVNLDDLSTLLAHYGTTSGAAAVDGDADGDGDVDLNDLAALLARFGTACP